jgi:hypothetical protein
MRLAVHDSRVQFDNPVFVRQTAVSDAEFIRIVFHQTHAINNGVHGGRACMKPFMSASHRSNTVV